MPVGLVLERARLANPSMELYAADGKHPSKLGSYLAASVFFAALYGESPQGASYTAGLNDEAASFAQTIAWETVQAFFNR